MPRCPSGTRRCPPSVGKCHKTGKSGKTAKKQPKIKKSAPKLMKTVETTGSVDSTTVKRTWIEHLKWCSNHFDIKYGKAMTDARCRKIWKDTH